MWYGDRLPEALTENLMNDYMGLLEYFFCTLGWRNYKDEILLPSLIYMERFLQKAGINQDDVNCKDIFFTLLISGGLSLKMWSDYGGWDHTIYEQVTGLSRRKMSQMERRFLQTIDYQLYISPDESENWFTQKEKEALKVLELEYAKQLSETPLNVLEESYCNISLQVVTI